MKKKFSREYIEDVIKDEDDKWRNELQELSEREDNWKESIRQMIAVRQGRVMMLKDLRVRILNETGIELKGTKAPKDIRKEK